MCLCSDVGVRDSCLQLSGSSRGVYGISNQQYCRDMYSSGSVGNIYSRTDLWLVAKLNGDPTGHFPIFSRNMMT